MQAVILSTSGISAWHNRITSGVQACCISWRPPVLRIRAGERASEHRNQNSRAKHSRAARQHDAARLDKLWCSAPTRLCHLRPPVTRHDRTHPTPGARPKAQPISDRVPLPPAQPKNYFAGATLRRFSAACAGLRSLRNILLQPDQWSSETTGRKGKPHVQAIQDIDVEGMGVEGMGVEDLGVQDLGIAWPHGAVGARGHRRAVRGLPDQAGEMGGGLSAGRHHRHSRADHGPVSFRASRPAIRDRQPARRRQQHRHRSGGELPARRLHDPAGQSRPWHQRDPLQAAAVQLPARHRARRRHHAGAECDGNHRQVPRQDGRANSSPTARPILARSTWPRPATAPRCISRASCSWR